MPTYEYACTECGERLEVVQSFSDDPLTICPSCAGKLRKVFSPVGVVFKGSGFYKNDSRSGASKASSGTSGEPAKAGAEKGSSGGSDGGSSSSDATSSSSTSSKNGSSSGSSGGSSKTSSSSGTKDGGSKVA